MCCGLVHDPLPPHLGVIAAELQTTVNAPVNASLDTLALGQYLRPTRHHLPVQRFVHPDEFAALG